MRAKPGNLKVLDKYFDKGKNFVMTQEEYEKETDGILSKDLNYIKNRSALSRKALERGFYIEVEPIEIKPMRIIFRKK